MAKSLTLSVTVFLVDVSFYSKTPSCEVCPTVFRDPQTIFRDPHAPLLKPLRQVVDKGHAEFLEHPPAAPVPERVTGFDTLSAEARKTERYHRPRRLRHVAFALLFRMGPKAEVPNVRRIRLSEGHAPDEVASVRLNDYLRIISC